MVRYLYAALFIACSGVISYGIEPVILKPGNKSTAQASQTNAPATEKKEIRAPNSTTMPQLTSAKPKYKYKKRTNKKRRIMEGNPEGKTLSHMNLDELRCAKNRALKAKNLEVALKYMQRMIPLCTDLIERGALMLEVADALLATGSIKEASAMYQDFAAMYPGHERIIYALYKAIACSYATVLIPERDQTATLATIELAEQFLKQHDPSTPHYQSVDEILQSCYQLRFDSEVSIINFYLNQKNIAAAQRRIERLREKQLPIFPKSEQSLIELECTLARNKNDTQLLLQKQAELSTKFPQTKNVMVAKNKRSVDHVCKF